MSLLTNPILIHLYRELQSHGSESKPDAFWQTYLASQFPQSEGYALSCQWSPSDDDRERVDAAVREILGSDENISSATLLLFAGPKHPGGNTNDAEDQLEKAARKHLDYNIGDSVYGMSGWEGKVRCWIIERATAGCQHQMRPMFGPNEHGNEAAYADADSAEAFLISASILYMKRQSTVWPQEYALSRQ
ncbi:hypothetical protein QQS21_006702 [Conoideocrella luteorostrata]|uniref:Uncharacterized protein n=1 Tax=Conoideocrella luteorostrata TaxID=1105319 RepID=A0AAJ0G011_9HYPO|nr:hypothetical protein QQS21_006702 [Conoideocrella luteorostrata]